MSTAALQVTRALDASAPAVRARIDSIDFLRGAVMVLMALDHVRDFFTNVRYDPLDLTQASAALFLTRFVTHYCAPVFVFLAGTSAYRVARRASPAYLTRFLWTRGLWLVFLECTVVSFAWAFRLPWNAPPGAPTVVLQVIWAIGWSMIAMAALVRLPLAAIVGVALAMIVGHNAFDGVAPGAFGAAAPLWNILHVPGRLPGGVFLVYPLIPWIGVMAAGYGFGALYDIEDARRRRLIAGLGLALIALFLVLRLPNLYGDPHPWSAQATPARTVLSVLNVTKYPPSLLYLCATLGPALLVLVAAERWRGRLAGALTTIGRVPLFFYVAHLYVAHLAAGVIARFGLGIGAVLHSFPRDPAWGFGLPGVYLAWASVVVALYPACRWFAGVKARRRDWWLSYL